jgi:hypothetical protein
MKKILKIVAVIVIALPVLALGWLVYSTDKNLASPTPEALTALASDDAVVVDDGDRVQGKQGLVLVVEKIDPL